MLLELTIKDFAIIDSLKLRLNRQFNVFTGETGAGKSIIIDAVNALLGGKIGAEMRLSRNWCLSLEGNANITLGGSGSAQFANVLFGALFTL